MKYVWLVPLTILLFSVCTAAQSTSNFTVADAQSLMANFSSNTYSIPLPSTLTLLIGNNNAFDISITDSTGLHHVGYAVEKNGKLTQISTTVPSSPLDYMIDIQLSTVQQVIAEEESDPSNTRAIQNTLLSAFSNNQLKIIPFNPNILEQIEIGIFQLLARFM